jgi:curved DNA-binding protein
MVFKDYYKILGLENSKVTLQEIKVAFREQAKKHHPDINRKNPNAEERFKDINEAYKILSEDKTKRKYDRIWNAKVGKKKRIESNQNEGKRPTGSAVNEFINMFFGASSETTEKKQANVPEKGEDIETEINIKLEDAYYGLEKKISLRNVKGKMTTFTVKVPAGIRNGEKIRLIGQGKEGIRGGKNGDLFIRINIQKNDKFKLEGCDLVTDLYLTPWEAALGKEVNINAMEENIMIKVPAGIQSGERIKIEDKGYKDGQGGRGSLIAEVKTVVPKQLTEQEQDLFKRNINI